MRQLRRRSRENRLTSASVLTEVRRPRTIRASFSFHRMTKNLNAALRNRPACGIFVSATDSHSRVALGNGFL